MHFTFWWLHLTCFIKSAIVFVPKETTALLFFFLAFIWPAYRSSSTPSNDLTLLLSHHLFSYPWWVILASNLTWWKIIFFFHFSTNHWKYKCALFMFTFYNSYFFVWLSAKFGFKCIITSGNKYWIQLMCGHTSDTVYLLINGLLN